MTKLYRDLVMSQTPRQPQGRGQSDTKSFIAEASRKGFSMNVQDFMRFAEMAKGRDMGQVIQDLRESGDIDENTFQDLKRKATGFMGLLKMVTGK